jgi:hypothetical protein
MDLGATDFPQDDLSAGVQSPGLAAGVRKFAADENVRALGLDPLVVQLALGDRKHLPGQVDDRVAALLDDKLARDDRPANLEKMPVPPFAGTGASF